MNKNALMGIVAIVLVIIGGFVLLKIYNPSGYQAPAGTSKPTIEPTKEEVIITYTPTGFSPPEVTLKNGGKITWINKGDREVKIGANPHPIHTGNREVSGGEFTLDLQPGGQKTVVVSKVGTLGYHNHLNASEGGTIIVK